MKLAPHPDTRTPATPGTMSSQLKASDNAYYWLVSQMMNTDLIDSYEDDNDIGYTYDQAVAVIAFLAKSDVARARKILDALKNLQQSDGAWYTSYYGSTGKVQQKFCQIGPILWVTLAVAHYERMTGDCITYRDMAQGAIRWSLQFQQADGGINGGFGEDNKLAPWCSTEHNEDAYAALTYFGYLKEAAAVKNFIDTACWDNTNQRFIGGRNDPRDPMDVNSWGVVSLGSNGTHPYAMSLNYVLMHHRSTQTATVNGTAITIDGFDFNSNKDDIWLEGQGEMAVAFKMVGRQREANHFINEIIKLQEADGGTGVRYSLKGTYNDYWTMLTAKSVSASGWLIFAIHGINPLRP